MSAALCASTTGLLGSHPSSLVLSQLLTFLFINVNVTKQNLFYHQRHFLFLVHYRVSSSFIRMEQSFLNHPMEWLPSGLPIY